MIPSLKICAETGECRNGQASIARLAMAHRRAPKRRGSVSIKA
jgi:hypothetical protein